MNQSTYPAIMNLSRHRIGTDGNGVVTLVPFWGCPLHCKYCINDFCHDEAQKPFELSPEELYEKLKADDIYFRMSGGGVVFGGGEPLLHPEYIADAVKLFPSGWSARIETSLYISDIERLKPLISRIDQWIVDIKDTNPAIYRSYTGKDNNIVLRNLSRLSEWAGKERLLIRIPRIPGYNDQRAIEASVERVGSLGTVDVFNYKVLNGEEV